MRTVYILLISSAPVLIYNAYFMYFGEHKGIDSTQVVVAGIIGILSYSIAEKLIKKS